MGKVLWWGAIVLVYSGTLPAFLSRHLLGLSGCKVSGPVAQKKGHVIIKTLMQRLEQGETVEDVRHLGATMKSVEAPTVPDVD